jgi:NNP family nitrate/nitrite transporter-like MFS transporter
MTFFSGWITDNFGEKKAIALFLFCSGVVTMFLGLFTGAWLKVMVFLQPALIACYFPPGFAALSRIVQPDYRSLATSWVTPAALVWGAGCCPLPWLHGRGIFHWHRHHTGGGAYYNRFSTAFFLKLIDKMEEGC